MVTVHSPLTPLLRLSSARLALGGAPREPKRFEALRYRALVAEAFKGFRCCASLLGCIAAVAVRGSDATDVMAARRAELQLLEHNLIPSLPPEGGRITTQDLTWEQWIHRTGELPPDFSAMPSQPFLPDPLVVQGSQGGQDVAITSAEQWAAKRTWIRAQFEQWICGRMPPPPGNVRVATSQERREGDVTVREVLIEFGPDHRAKLHLKLTVPPGAGPFPVFLTDQPGDNVRSSPLDNDHSFGWISTAVRRGYIGCFYQATYPDYGAPDDADAFLDVYPQFDFSSLARRAWAASRAIDYLLTLPNVIPSQIGIAGHSRNGKQALLAAAFDERIGAVVASSGLAGEALPYRDTTDPFAVESIELITGGASNWFHPRLRFFTGREDKLPVDENSLMALVAPRGLLITSGYSEYSSNAFGSEAAYRSALTVYRFLKREDRIWLSLRAGPHTVRVSDIEQYVDFLDTVFGRKQFPKAETLLHDYSFEQWKRISGEKVDPLRFPARKPGSFGTDGDRGGMQGRLRWALGNAPAEQPLQLVHTLKEDAPPDRNPLELVLGRPLPNQVWHDKLAAAGMGIASLPYAPGLTADVFYPLDGSGRRRAGKLPVVIWLHPYAYDAGWSAKEPWRPVQRDFVLDQRPSFDSLARRGFIVVAFDQIGFGGRALDARLFYERYPQWSLMGQMVADTTAVARAAAALSEADSSRIYLLGYSLGAKVGLLTAALGAPVRGVAAICGVDALRLDTPDRGTEGLRHYSHLHGLIPRLGFFVGNEARAPFDYDEVLALAAPRSVLIVAPQFDRYARVDDVRREVEAARPAYLAQGAGNALELWTPPDFNRFPRGLQEKVFDYLEKSAAAAAVAR
jgi:pimeloyl-ACP methyl ester carboxylesterase